MRHITQDNNGFPAELQKRLVQSTLNNAFSIKRLMFYMILVLEYQRHFFVQQIFGNRVSNTAECNYSLKSVKLKLIKQDCIISLYIR